MIEPVKLYSGEKFTICEAFTNGKSRLNDFLNDLNKNVYTRVINSIEYIGNYGPPKNTGRFNYEGDSIYAIKNGQVRIYCFFYKNQMIILTHGVIKKTQKANPKELKKARKIRSLFLKEKDGTL